MNKDEYKSCTLALYKKLQKGKATHYFVQVLDELQTKVTASLLHSTGLLDASGAAFWA
jgi:hypothetical protein